ncbi:MAG: type III-A CRISPR-associated RAMP protein Csm5 [Defluviitaleaceae bacterium]|nr:type III-A CRISPR-associated RAMP protein Csm5 [Defluviitaleaceae bacterium]
MKKNYTVTLTTLSPVFIGSGKVMRKNQYIYQRDKNIVRIIDEMKLIQILRERKLFNKFLDEVSQNKLQDLYKFLKINGISSANAKDLVKYSLSVVSEKNTDSPMNDLHLFVRNGNGDAYIPGSSLKGALRTCILETLSEDTKENEKFLDFSISDSTCMENESFEIQQKIDFSKKVRGLPLYRECIKTGTKVKFNLALEDKYINISEIKKSIRKTYMSYHKNWATHVIIGQTELSASGFNSYYNLPNDDQSILYLGGGAGFVSKTLHYKEKEAWKARKDILEILEEKFKNMKQSPYSYKNPNRVQNPNTAPIAIKLARYRGSLIELGKCELSFEEIRV